MKGIEIKAAYVAGIFDCHGDVNIYGTRVRRVTMFINQAETTRAVIEYCANLGIVVRRHRVSKKRKGYRCVITGQTNIKRFYGLVGPWIRFGERLEKLRYVCESYQRPPSVNEVVTYPGSVISVNLGDACHD